jgi:hypothetical protein
MSVQTLPSSGLTKGGAMLDMEAMKGEKSFVEVSSSDDSSHDGAERINVPLIFKLGAILMVSAIGFGSHWSSGVTGAMKTTLKKVSILCPLLLSRSQANFRPGVAYKQ